MRRLVSMGLLIALAACGQASSNMSSQTPKSESTSELKAPGEAKVGDKSLCPVSKEEFTINAQSPHVEHQGKTYYFCCAGCEKKFKENPEKYVSEMSSDDSKVFRGQKR